MASVVVLLGATAVMMDTCCPWDGPGVLPRSAHTVGKGVHPPAADSRKGSRKWIRCSPAMNSLWRVS
jgi:hypothetical protein